MLGRRQTKIRPGWDSIQNTSYVPQKWNGRESNTDVPKVSVCVYGIVVQCYTCKSDGVPVILKWGRLYYQTGGGGSQVPEHNKLKNKIIYVLRHSRPDPQTLRRRIAATGLVFGPTMSCRSWNAPLLTDGALYRVVDNGVETVTVEEDGQMKSKTVNGVAVPLGDVQQDVAPQPEQPQQQQQQGTSEL